MSTRDAIIDKLTRRFAPTRLEVVDESHRHQGHAGWRKQGETHFRVKIEAPQLEGKPRLAQHRAIMETLDEEMKGGVHALAIEIVRPGDVAPPPNQIA